MTRWDWTWEDRSQTSQSPKADSEAADEQGDRPSNDDPARERSAQTDAPPPTQRGGGNNRAAIVRRRRSGAGLLLIVAVVLIAALSAHGRSNSPRAHPPKHVVVPVQSTAQRAQATAKAEQNAINSVLAYTPAISSGGSKGNELALTFDDGPGPYTQQLVATLNKLHVHATFFAIGSQEQYFSAGTVDEIKSGDVIGDHTETHPMMATLSAHDQYEELFEQMARIELLGGVRPRLFRPPYGSFNATTFRELHHLHLLMVLWSVDTSDYTLPGVSAIVQSALAGAKPGAIILMHDGGGDRSETIAALPAIVAGLRKRGLHPVTIPRLMMDDPPPHGLPLPTNLSGD